MKNHFTEFTSREKWKLLLLFLLPYFASIGAVAQTAVPYNWNNLAIGGGGFVSAVIPSTAEQNLWYARTDVGGAYRWDEANSKWIPLLDWVSDDQVGYLGVESLALDPNAPNKLYMQVGISYFNGGRSAILRSDDYGKTFSVTEVTNQFRVHGNGMGRQNGERLQVDPNNGNILYTGTRWNGLFKSTDAGASWTRLNALNVTTTPNENGLSLVLLDPSAQANGATQRIFAGVSRTGTNFYRSDDGGQSFTAVAGAPTDLMPQRAIIAGGSVYITYANGAGPHGHWAVPEPFDAGQIWKYNISTGTWTNVTPAGFTRAFGGISADPTNPQRLIASTINNWMLQDNAYGDRFFMSTDGGNSWTDIVARGFDLDPNGVTWIDGHAIHWAGSIEFDPFNPQRVFVTSGNGIFVNNNIDATQGVWKFMVDGLEETVPIGLESIADGPLLTVILDYDGFRHTDPAQYAPIHTPRMGSTTGLAVAAQNPNKVLRAGSGLYYSTDMGLTWTQSTSQGEKGQVAISADGATFLHAPEGSSVTYRSVNNGGAWTAVSGASVMDARPVADPINAAKFYMYDPGTGRMLVSTNGGASFAAAGTAGSGGSKVIRAVPGIEGDVWVPLYGGGLKRSVNSGQSFSTISGVSYCAAVGFGKAAPGAAFPAVYIWGTVGNVRGIYRSDDGGVSWVRINDDDHEYGGPGNGQFVQGDMNVYGRVYMSTAGRGVVYGEAAESGNTLTVSPGTLAFSSAGGSQNLSISANLSWTASSNVAWLSVSPAAGTNNGTSAVTAQANGGSARTGTITISGGGITRTVTVSQEAANTNTSNTIVIRARGTAGGENIELRLDNEVVARWTLSKSFADYSKTTTANGMVTVHFTNDGRRRDVQVDYILLNGQSHQAEAQEVNTGLYVNNSCGGSYSEWLHCNGYISFVQAAGVASQPVLSAETAAVTKALVTYPNPVVDELRVHLRTLSPQTSIKVISSSGQVLQEERPTSLIHTLDMRKRTAGLYFIVVQEGEMRSVVKVFKR